MKNVIFKKSVASLAVAAALGAVGTSVQAVNLATDGIGQVAISPYFTVNGGWDTYINVTNTSDKTVVAKVRFREAYNSQDVRDFYIILSPYDVWTATVTDNGAGGARVQTTDNSCTTPRLPTIDPNVGSTGLRGIDFTNFAYAVDGVTRDDGPQGLDRTREGYWEIIEAGVTADNNDGDDIAHAARHQGGAGGNTMIPEDCNFFSSTNWDSNLAAIQNGLDAPENNLKVNSTLINVLDGNGTGINPTILANLTTEDDIVYRTFDERERPNLGSGDNADNDGDPNQRFNGVPSTSQVVVNDPAQAAALGLAPGATLADPTHANGYDAVTAVLQRNKIVNEFVNRPGADSEWVVTFPTKRFYVDTHLSNDNLTLTTFAPYGSTGVPPFSDWFGANPQPEAGTPYFVPGVACDDVDVIFADREEFRVDPNTGFSPPELLDIELCYEVNTITFGDRALQPGGDLLGSAIDFNIDTSAVGHNGWVEMDLTDVGLPGEALDDNDDTVDRYTSGDQPDNGIDYFGMPAIGFLLKSLDNGVTGGNVLKYMSSWEHGYGRDIVQSGVVDRPFPPIN